MRPKKNIRYKFVRFGSLKPQMHDLTAREWFHTAPVVRGIYAFPQGFVEGFLIGGVGSGSLQNGRFSKFKDSKTGKVYRVKGSEFEEFKKKFSKDIQRRLRTSYTHDDWLEEIEDDDDNDYCYEDFEKKYNEGTWDVWIENTPTRFTYGGLIWHHLFNSDCPQKDKEYPYYIAISGSWVLTDMPTYVRCLNAKVGRDKYHSTFAMYYDNPSGPAKRSQPPGLNYGGRPYPYSKDDFEVFIEDIQNDNKFGNRML